MGLEWSRSRLLLLLAGARGDCNRPGGRHPARAARFLQGPEASLPAAATPLSGARTADYCRPVPIPRVQLFEFNDSAWAPAALRELLIEALSRTLAWGRILRALATPFASFVEQTGVREVLDLCAGAGGPAAILARELRQAGRTPPRFLLTDLLPHPEAWEALRRADPDGIGYLPDSIDATVVPRQLGAGRCLW